VPELVYYSWLIPALPLLAAVVIGSFAIGGGGLKRFAHIPAILAMLGAAAIALGILQGFSSGRIGTTDINLFQWFSVSSTASVASNFVVPVTIHLDQLTALYLSFITGIGLLIFIYASGYMKGDFGYFRFFAYMCLFVFFMTCLVLGNNFLLLYLGWEGVGLASYLLIGYYYPRPTAVAAAKKAFITNRIGDFGLAIGVFLIYRTFGTVEYKTVFEQLQHPAKLLTEHPLAMYAIPFCLMLAAFGKSAQFPLHVWLPDAMEGPTPVSALIHAATMVTAGIYLIARTMPLFIANPANHDALNVVACIGCFTAFMAATIALCQYDLKRIWAYSTLSQLGYMFLGLGVSAGSAAVFHVFTHAFFKALLFLAAGSVMHAMGGELDIRKMSGLRKYMPKTAILTLIGCLALAGFPGLAGFFSKDEIIAAAFNARGVDGHFSTLGLALGCVALVVALMTAYYTFRVFFRVFMGPVVLPATAGHHEPSPFALTEQAGHGDHSEHADQAHAAQHAPQGHAEHDATEDSAHQPNDGPAAMWAPLILLALGAITAGYLGVFGGPEGGWMAEFLSHSFGGKGDEDFESLRVAHSTMMGVSASLAVIGIAVAWFFHLKNRHAATILAANMKPLVKFLENKWYIDELYNALIIKPLWILGHICSIFDRFVVDGAVFVVGFAPQLLGYALKPTQRGLLQRYAIGMIAGIAILVIGALYILGC